MVYLLKIGQIIKPDVILKAWTNTIGGYTYFRNPILKSQMQEVYNLPVDFAAKANACIGAALAVQTNQDIA